jgi:valyl-tRNA synthetase
VTDERLAGAALLAMGADQFEGSARARLSTEIGDAGRADWEGNLRFYPSRYAKTFQTWHENIRDWCISRQLWWGHRIPVWSRPKWNGEDYTEAGVRAYFAKYVVLPALDNDDARTRGAMEGFACIYTPDALHICFKDASVEQAVRETILKMGYTQDPDVLDTWFSSGLWPLSTLNWPSDTPELKTWNPSNVLVTAREIITLWASRMVMFNLYFRDCLPFTEVFIHAMIQDGEGQKMSKTLGNGVDPLDIIESHGADAMRFTLAAMTTHTQDLRMPVDLVCPHSGETFSPAKITLPSGYVVAAPIQESPKMPGKRMVSSYGAISGQAKPTDDLPLAKNTSSKFDEGRKFANKIWQVALNFVAPNLSKILPEPSDPPKWSMADRWIVSRFNRTIAEADEMLRAYRFDQYAKSVYDFFWNDFCGWYVEASKPALRDPSRAGQTANLLAAVLDGSLRLLHPLMPFITETIWWKLNEARPQRGLPGQLECPAAKRLIRAAWPKGGAPNEEAERVFRSLQDIIIAIRNVRNQYKVDVKKRVTVSIAPPDEDAVKQTIAAKEMIELLGTCTVKEVCAGLPPVEKASRTSVNGFDVYVEGLVDEAAEGQRANKRLEELSRQETALLGRLSNDSYAKKAPAHLVQQTRNQLAEVQAELAKLRGN